MKAGPGLESPIFCDAELAASQSGISKENLEGHSTSRQWRQAQTSEITSSKDILRRKPHLL